MKAKSRKKAKRRAITQNPYGIFLLKKKRWEDEKG